jgi:hypothetical protein
MFKQYSKVKSISLIGCILFFVPCGFGAITSVSDLSFGTIAVLKNDGVSEIRISTTNQTFLTNHIRVLVPGQRAEYLISGYPAFTQLFTSANITNTETFSPAPSSEQFTLSALDVVPSVTTDASGNATIFVGGTLQTSGTGSGQYYDTDYTVFFELTVNF